VFARINRGISSGDALGDLRQQPTIAFTSTENAEITTTTVGLTSSWTSVSHELRVNVSRHRGSLSSGPARYTFAEPLPVGLLAASAEAQVRVNVFPAGDGVLINGLTSVSTQTQLEAADTWGWRRGRQEWQAGLDFRRVTAESTPPTMRYTYAFANLVASPQARPLFVTMDWVTPASARLHTWAAFVQHTVRLSSRASLQYGVRAMRQAAPVSLTSTRPLIFEESVLPELRAREAGDPLWQTPAVTLSPRIEGIYHLTTAATRGVLLRAGWSLVYDDTAAPGVAAFGRGYPYVVTSVLRPPQFPIAPADLAAAHPADTFTGATIAEAYAVPMHLRTPRTQEWHVGLERELGPGQHLSIAYVGAAGRALFYGYTHSSTQTTRSRQLTTTARRRITRCS